MTTRPPSGLHPMTMIDRDNLMAVAWGVIYAAALVLCVGAGDAIGIAPTVTVPLVVIPLPIAIGVLLRSVERAVTRRHHG